MYSFTYSGVSARVIFGSGTVRTLRGELERLGLERALFLSTPGQEDFVRECAQSVGPVAADVFSKASMHTPVSITDMAMQIVRDLRVDGIVAIGGGSTIGLAKAIAWRTDLPQVVVPTTYSGSEMTPILGETENGQKVTRSHPKIQPETVIYDVDLTETLPRDVAVASGMNAMAHAVEALYAENRNPVVSLVAIEAIGSLYNALSLLSDPRNDELARKTVLYGAWLSGMCLGSVDMSLHHKLCHTLGGLFDLPHAETHAALLPHVLAYNAPAIPEVIEKLSEIFRRPDPAQCLYELNHTLRVKPALRELGMPEAGIEQAVSAALDKPYKNPRTLDRQGLTELLRRAHCGLRPAST